MLAAVLGTGGVVILAVIGAAWKGGRWQGMVVVELASIRRRLDDIERGGRGRPTEARRRGAGGR